MSEDSNSGWGGPESYIKDQAKQECKLMIDEGKLLATQLPKCTRFGERMAHQWDQGMQMDADAHTNLFGTRKLHSNEGEISIFLVLDCPQPPQPASHTCSSQANF